MTNQDMSNGRNGPMTSERLYQILESYGGAPAGWPEDERDAARTLIDTFPQARALQESAFGLDGILDDLTPPAPSSELITRLENAALRAAAPYVAAPAKRLGWLKALSGLLGPQQWAPAALSLTGIALIAAALLLVGRGDEVQPPPPVAVASSETAPASDYLVDMPLVDTAAAELPADDASAGERFTVMISARQTALASDDDPDALSDPWIELLADDGQVGGLRLNTAALSEIPLE